MILTGPAERWRSRTTFVFALSIATVGVGNLWRFAWLMGDNGGGPFVLSYLFCLLLVGVPLLAAEIVLGTHGRGSPILSVAWAIHAGDRSRIWLVIPMLTALAALAMLVVSMLVAGWALFYAFQQQLGTFAAMPLEDVSSYLVAQIDNPSGLLIAQLFVALLVGLLGAAGVRRGMGSFAWLALPILVWLLGVLVRYAIEFGDLKAAGAFLFTWQVIDFDGGSFLAALGHALFTLSIGVAVGLSFGAYAPARLPVIRSVIAVALFDLVVAVAAGVALYPLLFAANVEPARDFALLFVGVPFTYGAMPFGDLYGTLFFTVVLLAALGSALALLEPILAILEQQLRLPRRYVAPAVAGLAWVVSCFATIGLAGSGELLELLDRGAGLLLIPLAMLLLALFVGWRLPLPMLQRELRREPGTLVALWYFLLRFVAGPVIAIAWLWLVLVP